MEYLHDHYKKYDRDDHYVCLISVISVTDCDISQTASTYGTFQAGGQRIAPNVPTRLSPKSSIYLGEPENTICLDVE